MGDLGLLAGLAQGLKSGVESYRSERDYQDKKLKDAEEKALRDRMYRASLMEHGLEESDGGIIKKNADQTRRDRYDELTRQAGLLKSGQQIVEDDKGVRLQPVAGFKDLENENRILQNRRLKEELGAAAAERPLKQRKMLADIALAEKKELPLGASDRLAKMGGDVKQKIGFIADAMNNLKNYSDVYESGGRQGLITPESSVMGIPVGKFKGSTPIDEARTNVSEAIGRLASGGAISKDEEARFLRMIPAYADDEPTARRKLQQLRESMETKLVAYGFKTGDLADMGFDPGKLGYGKSPMQAGGGGQGLLKSYSDPSAAQAAPRQATPEDNEAVTWAKVNPGDPRAAEILKINGVK